jgi:glycosyltransferase involved in cell wall biosynthesis
MRYKLILSNKSKRLSVLRLVLSICESSAPYNQFCLPLTEQQDITICSYFKSKILVPNEIKLYEGNGSVKYFMSLLKSALGEKDYDIIHAHTPHVGLLFLIISFFNSNKYISKSVYTFHSSYNNYKLKNKLLLLPIFAFFRKIVCCSNSSYENLPVFYLWLAGKRICIIQNGVNLERIDNVLSNKQMQRKENNFFIILSIGRLIDVKNPTCLLKAFKNCGIKNSKLIFIGNGYLKNSLVNASKCYKNVEFTGLIKRNEVYKYLQKADLFVSTSKVEGLPISVLEAMANSCPVILSDIPPHREIAEFLDFIPLLDPNNIKEFSEEILKYSKMLPRKRKEMGKKCRKLVEKRFSLNIMLKKYEELYSRLLN